jgi:aspartate racemase
MRTIGLIGGMSWESSAVYYRAINELVRDRLGGHHCAKSLLATIQFADLAPLQAAGDWDAANALVADAARSLAAGGAECVVICANTMHLAVDAVRAAVELPVIHIGDCTADAIRTAGVDRVAWLATRYTMELPFLREHLAARGVECVVPDETERADIQRIIYDELVQGRVVRESRERLIEIVRRLDAPGVALACTELGMLLAPADIELPLFDTAQVHAAAAVDWALS